MIDIAPPVKITAKTSGTGCSAVLGLKAIVVHQKAAKQLGKISLPTTKLAQCPVP